VVTARQDPEGLEHAACRSAVADSATTRAYDRVSSSPKYSSRQEMAGHMFRVCIVKSFDRMEVYP
jgi:hypothetical protein